MKGDVMKQPPSSKKKIAATQSREAPPESAYTPHSEVNEGNYLGITIKDVKGALGNVKHGFDYLAARNLIHYFHYRLKDGCLFDNVQLRPTERAFVDYVEYAFARMVEQKKSPEVAFGLAPGRGEHQRESTVERDVVAAAYVTLLMRNNWKWEDAKGEAANFLFHDGKGEKAVEKAYADHKEVFAWMPNESLMDLLPTDIPTIKSR